MVSFASPSNAAAQAWLPMQGEGAVTTSAQLFHVSWHLEFDGSRQEETNVRIRNISADFVYGLTNRIAVSVGLPVVSSKWGALPHPCPPNVVDADNKVLYRPCAEPENPDVDNGRFHTTVQDFRANVRYGFWRRHVTVTPVVGVVLPSRAYVIHGHAAPGRRLRELNLGVHAGRSLGPKLPETYVHATYVYTISQRVSHHELDLNLNRSNAEIEVGHQVTPRFSLQGFMSWQIAHGGLEWTDDLFESDHEEIHDRAARASHRRAGVGLAIAVTPRVAINFSVLRTLAGKNSHKLDGITFGTTWGFSRGDDVIGK